MTTTQPIYIDPRLLGLKPAAQDTPPDPFFKNAVLVGMVIVAAAWISGRFDRAQPGPNPSPGPQPVDPSAVVDASAEAWRNFGQAVGSDSVALGDAVADGTLADHDAITAEAKRRWAASHDALIQTLGDLDNANVPQDINEQTRAAAAGYYQARGRGIQAAAK